MSNEVNAKKVLAIRSASQFADYLCVPLTSDGRLPKMLGIEQVWTVIFAHRRFCFIQSEDKIGIYLLGQDNLIATKRVVPLPCSPRFIWKHIDAMLPPAPSTRSSFFSEE